jgi:hypothetical protein
MSHMKPGRTWAVIAVFVGILIYFATQDDQAAVLWMITPALAFIVLRASYKRGLIATTAFCTFFFIAHGLGPSFFFLEREMYAVSGWGAVGNFAFTLDELAPQYAYVFALMFIIVGVVILLQLLTRVQPRVTQSASSLFPKIKNTRRWNLAALGIVGAGTLLSAFMFEQRIGMTGIEPPALPFHLSGLLFYFRVAVIPAVLFVCYRYSGRSFAIASLILFYAATAGLASVSRSTLVLSAAPVLFFALADKQYVRLALSTGFIVIVYQIISFSRDLVYFGEVSTFALHVLNADLLRSISADALPVFVADVARRLYGTQDIVLAFQHDGGDRLPALINLLLARPVVDDVAREIYGLDLYGTSFGLGMGLFAWLIIAAKGDWMAGMLFAAVIAFLLFLCEWLVRKWERSDRALSVLGLPLGVALAFMLYSAHMGLFYRVLMGGVLMAFVLEILRGRLLISWRGRREWNSRMHRLHGGPQTGVG